MQVAGDQHWQALQHGVVDQVVREGVAAQHVLAFQFGPGVGQFQRAARQQCFGQRNTKVHTRDGGHTRQLQRRWRQARQLLADQLRQRFRVRQARRVTATLQRPFAPCQLQCFQRKERVAARALVQQRGGAVTADPCVGGQAQAVDELSHLRHRQRLQSQPRVRPGRGQCVQQRLQAAAGGGRPQAQAPAQRRGLAVARCRQQALQQFQRGVVGKVQVVQRQRVHAAAGLLQERQHRARQRRLQGGGHGGRVGGQLRQQRGQLAAQGGVGGGGVAVQQLAQRTGDGGVGHQRVTGAATAVQQRGLLRGQRLQQARLAHAGLAHEHHHIAVVETARQCLQFGIATDQPRRPQHRRRHRAARARAAFNRCGLFDRGQQGQRLGRRAGADFMLQDLLAAVKGQHRRRAVAAQIVQAHDTAVRGFAQRLGVHHRLRQRQRSGGVARSFQHVDTRFAFTLHAGALAGAAAGQPGVEFGAVGLAEFTEQRRSIGQVMLHTRRQRQRGAARHHVHAHLLAQAEQALAQGVARGVAAAVGPKQGGQPFTRGGAFKRQPGQQQRVGGRERVGATRCRARRHAAESQLRRVRRRCTHLERQAGNSFRSKARSTSHTPASSAISSEPPINTPRR